MKIFALTTRGLESITQDEMTTVPDLHITNTEYRRIHATYKGDLSRLLALKTMDDIFITLAHWADIDHKRAMLPIFTEYARQLKLTSSIEALRAIRPLPEVLHFSITVSFVGKRNYNADEVKQAISEGMVQTHPTWHYSADDTQASVNIRIFIIHDEAVVGLRIGETPLHRRAYKQHSLQGSLKASVASAMVQSATLSKGQWVLDPFCGSGTILIEAIQQGIQAIGGDINPDVLAFAGLNAMEAGISQQTNQWDARALPIKTASVNCIVSNPPWGRQITVDASLKRLYQASFAEMQRVVKVGGEIILLTTLPEFIPATPTQQIEISLHGQRPLILRFVNC